MKGPDLWYRRSDGCTVGSVICRLDKEAQAAQKLIEAKAKEQQNYNSYKGGKGKGKHFHNGGNAKGKDYNSYNGGKGQKRDWYDNSQWNHDNSQEEKKARK